MTRARGQAAKAALPAVVAAIGLAAVVVLALPPFSRIPASEMSASRVVASVALASGISPYAGPADGPMVDFMYGPVSALVYSPSALASTPSGAILIAAIMNALAFFAPMVWLHGRGARVPWPWAAAAFALFASLVFRDLGLVFSAITIHADAAALGFAALACGALLGGRRGPHAEAASASCLVLAVWAKQPVAPLVALLPLFVWARDGWSAARRYVAWVAALGIVVSVGFAAVFGARELWLNLIVLPAGHPWYGEDEHGRLPALLGSCRLLVWQNRWTAALLAAVAVASAGAVRDGRGWLQRWSWPLLALAGVAMAPTAAVGGAKVGGFLNTHSFTSYFLLGAATVGLGEVAASRERMARLARVAIGLLVLGLAAASVRADGRRELAAAVERLRAWSANEQEEAFRFARAHPGEVFLPWNPLASLLADGRLYHNEVGAWNRELAGVAIDPAHWARHLPPRMRLLAFKPNAAMLAWLPPADARHPELSETVEVPALPGWRVRRRPAPAGGATRTP